jgi:hypothetical protein
MRDNLHLLFRVFSTTFQQTLQQQFSGRRYFGDGVLSRNWIKGSVQYPATDGYPALANESSIIHRLDRLFACACKTARWTCFVFLCFLRCTLDVFVIRLDSPDLPGSQVGVLWERCHNWRLINEWERKHPHRRQQVNLAQGQQQMLHPTLF